MKKIYMTPEMEVMKMHAVQMLSGSTTVPFTDETVDDITFSAHEEDFDFEFDENEDFDFEE